MWQENLRKKYKNPESHLESFYEKENSIAGAKKGKKLNLEASKQANFEEVMSP